MSTGEATTDIKENSRIRTATCSCSFTVECRSDIGGNGSSDTEKRTFEVVDDGLHVRVLRDRVDDRHTLQLYAREFVSLGATLGHVDPLHGAGSEPLVERAIVLRAASPDAARVATRASARRGRRSRLVLPALGDRSQEAAELRLLLAARLRLRLRRHRHRHGHRAVLALALHHQLDRVGPVRARARAAVRRVLVRVDE